MEQFGGLEKLKKNEKMECNGMVKMSKPNKWLVYFDYILFF